VDTHSEAGPSLIFFHLSFSSPLFFVLCEPPQSFIAARAILAKSDVYSFSAYFPALGWVSDHSFEWLFSTRFPPAQPLHFEDCTYKGIQD
jgi:hypothetical protein